MRGAAVLLLLTTLLARADSVPVRFPQGTSHGFLVLHSMDGKLLANGDMTQHVIGREIKTRLRFEFKDGSLDDEQAVFSQDGVFRLLEDHHVQRGPSFPTPMDMSLDVRSGTVTTRERKEDGEAKVETKHMDLPPDLANGLILTLLTNIRDAAPETDLPYLAMVGSPRVVHLHITPGGPVRFRVDRVRIAREFHCKVDIGGVPGVAALVLGKIPKPAEFLILEDEAAPAFVREEGQLFEGGPVWRIEQVGPTSR